MNSNRMPDNVDVMMFYIVEFNFQPIVMSAGSSRLATVDPNEPNRFSRKNTCRKNLYRTRSELDIIT